MATETFVVLDYVIFLLTLCISLGIGVYFGCFGSKQKTATEYLLGKGSMKSIPVGLSIFSSAVSVVTIVGTPGEMYTFGSQFFISYFGFLLSLPITWYFVLPVFCGKLKIKSPYEYFELRFNYKIHLLSTILYVIQAMFLLPIVLYGSSVSFSEISQISLPLCTTTIGGICIVYTMLGGFAAVIWSDTLQASLMIASCVFVMIKGILDLGSISVIFHRIEQGQRLNLFDMNPNPFKRLTFWSALVGMCLHYTPHSGCSASSIQRYLALRNEKQARISTSIGSIGTFFIGTIMCIIGLTMYAQYYDCDPVQNKEVSNYNKVFSLYIASTLKNIPGYLGLFNAGILSAGLSTISAELNTASGLMYHSIIKKYFKSCLDEFKGAIIMKVFVFILGLYCLIVAPILDKFEYLSGFAIGVHSISLGAILGMMILATTLPTCNSIGIAVGTAIGLFLTGWISFGSLYYNINAAYVLPLSNENCSNTNTNFTVTTNMANSTTLAPILPNVNEIPLLYQLSYMYYVPFGAIVTIIVALIVSYFTGVNDVNKMDPNLFIPWVRPKNTENYTPESVTMLSQDENYKIDDNIDASVKQFYCSQHQNNIN